VTATHRGRFAPSPTGRLHLGNAWAAVLGWLWARSQGGEFLLRIEDLDTARSRPALTDALLADLAWLGLGFDGDPIIQSRRLDLYRAALDRLRATGRVYPCFCTRSEIARAVSAPHGPADEGPRYPGTCLPLSAEQGAERARTRPPAWRFHPRDGLTEVRDLLHGTFVQDAMTCSARRRGKYSSVRRSGSPSRCTRTFRCFWDPMASGSPSVLGRPVSPSCASGASHPSVSSACSPAGPDSETASRWASSSWFPGSRSSGSPGHPSRWIPAR